jgi:hypothetical protein
LIAVLQLGASARLEAEQAVVEDQIELHGRVLLRGTLADQEGAARTTDLELASTRAEVRYERDWLRIVIEAELTRRSLLRDAYARVRSGGLRLKAGQFKVPVSIVQLDSIWTLPVLERGLLDDVLVDRMQVGGRRPGLALELAGTKQDLAPSIELGIFQGSAATGDFLDEAALGAQSIAARAGLSPKPFDVAVFGELRSVVVIPGEDLQRYWSAGADAKLDLELAGGYGLRLWAEGIGGSSWYDDDLFDERRATFIAGRAIGAFRLGGEKRGRGYVELFTMLSAIDPDTHIVDDRLWEATGGVNAGWWKELRFTLQGEVRRADRNVPPLLDALGPIRSDRQALLLQVGAAF